MISLVDAFFCLKQILGIFFMLQFQLRNKIYLKLIIILCGSASQASSELEHKTLLKPPLLSDRQIFMHWNKTTGFW